MLFCSLKRNFYTSIPPESVLSQIQRRLPSGLFRSDSEFYGCVSDTGFKIRTNYNYNMPFFVGVRKYCPPIAFGSVKENGSGSEVEIRIRVNIVVMLLDLFFKILLAFGAFWGLLCCIFVSLQYGLELFLPCGGSLIFFFIFDYFAFHKPARKMLNRLEEILIY